MNSGRRYFARGRYGVAMLVSLIALTGCNDDDRRRPGAQGTPPAPTYTIGGTVSGLDGTLTLLNNGGDARTIGANGTFSFATPLSGNAPYAVTVQTQPANQLCTVTNGSGVATANAVNVVVACETIRVTATVGSAGATVVGPDGVQVQIPAGALSEQTVIGIARSGAGAPAAPSEILTAHALYEFTPHDIVFDQPVTIRLPLPAGTDDPTVMMAGLGTDWTQVEAQVENGMAAITRNTFSWGGIYACAWLPGDPNLDPGGCVSARGTLSISSTPANAVAMTDYSIPRRFRVTMPGTVHLAFAYHVPVSCTNGSARLRRALLGSNGLVAEPLATVTEQHAPMVSNNVSPPGRAADGSVTFSVAVSAAANGRWFYQTQLACTHYRTGPRTYTLAVILDVSIDQPSGPSNPVPTYSVGGYVTGLSGTGLVLQNGGTDDLAVAANGTFTFSNEVAEGSAYNVSLRTQPTNPSQVCQVQNGTGTANGDVADVVVECVAATAKAWQTARTIDNHGVGEAELPQVGVDAAGNATAAWTFVTRDQVTGNPTSEVWANRYTESGGWATPVRIAQAVDAGMQDLKLAVFANGEAVAVWAQSAGWIDSVYSSRYLPGSGWTAPALLENSDAHAEALALGFETSGAAFAVWLQETGPSGTEDVWASRYAAGSGWSTPVPLESLDDSASEPHIAASADGTAIAIWGQSEGSSSVRMNRYVAGSGWTGDAAVPEASDYTNDELVIAMDDAGRAVVAFTRDGFSGSVLGLRYAGGAWTAAEPLRAGAIFYPARLAVAMRASGEALVMWVEGEGLNDMWAKPFGVLSGDAVPLGDSGSGGVRPDVAFDADGTAVAIWNYGVGGRVLASRYTHGAATSWSAPVAIVSGVSAHDAQLVIDPAGNAIAVWQQEVGSSHSDIGAAIYR